MDISVVAQLARVSRRVTRTAPAARRRLPGADWIAVAVLLAFLPVVHDMPTMLAAPYWLDEAWVALSVRFPLTDLPVATSSTPLGWTFLLRLVPGTDHLRVVPLVFHGLSVGAAYALGRLPRWPSLRVGIVAGTVTGAAVLLLPAQQVRHDLKQYSADAAVAVGVLALTAWTEQSWSRRRLAVVAATFGGGMLFSHVTAIVAPCVFGGLLLVTAIRRQWARLLEVAVAGFVAACAATTIYLTISARARTDAMRDFWAASFPEVDELSGYLAERADDLTPILGAPVLLIVGLVVVGAVTLARCSRPATAIAVLLLPVTVLVLGVTEVYPLLDPRTSHFFFVTAAAVAGIGLVGAANSAARLVGRALPGTPSTVVTAAICAILLGVFGLHNSAWYRFDGNEPGLERTPVTMMDVRSATEYVNAHRSRNDVVILNHSAWYGFAFYSSRDEVDLVAPFGNTVGWWVRMPTRSDVVMAPGTDVAGIRLGVDEALRLAGQRGGARIWLIRSFVGAEEAIAWQTVLADYRVEQVTGGMEPVVVISER
ncbi:hypothetical protein [Micromonospora sp. WMMD710]|uniref:hypothetical protein n=1 Tax=Micromonospora sp. WMMD710 TaxID=3016085 RepID=UPI0024181224|nr:hypothetical protein [Micromonospora sp. WMMD710]MDG4759776.1 hypothetical protein [Micromonospora sp. WMMD710]